MSEQQANEPEKNEAEKKEQGGPAGTASGSPGKSFSVMQERHLSSQQQEAANQVQEASSQPLQPPGTPDTTPAAQPASGKPKGKDFSAMSMRAPAPAPSPEVPAEATPAASQGRPKGKDFAAMANRRPALPVPAQGAPGLTPEQSRAAQMQAAARRAAGLPPLEMPTATSVTTTMPPIPVHPPQTSTNPHAAMGTAPAVVAPTAAAIASKARQEHMAKVEASEAARAAHPAQRHSMGANSATDAAATAPSTKPTSQPSTSESRLQGSAHTAPLTGPRMQDLLSSIDPNYTLDVEAEQQLLLMADDFLDKVTRQSIRLAQHRGSKTMDVQDVQLALSKQWGIVIPGLGAPVLKPSKPAGRVTASSSVKRKATDDSSGNPPNKSTAMASDNSSTGGGGAMSTPS